MRSSIKKRLIRYIAGLLMVCMLLPMMPAAAVEETIPETTEPVVTEPVVTEPTVTEPAITEPAITEPAVTEPAVTEPEVTEPEVTEPAVTEPETTEPALVVEDGDTATTLNADPMMTVTFDGAAFPEDGIYKGWNYDDKKTLKVALAGLERNKRYKVEVQLDEIVYFAPRPGEPEDKTYSVSFTQNEKLPRKTATGMDSYLHVDSGTAVFTFTPADSYLSFSVDLGYDVALWNRLADSLLRWDGEEARNDGTVDESLVKVTLTEANTEAKLSEQKLKDATAAIAHKANMSVADGVYGIEPTLEGTEEIRFNGYYTDQKIRMKVRGFANEFYFEKLVLNVELPHCIINGETYYMKLDKCTSASSSGADYDITIGDVVDGKVTITVPYIYEPSRPDIIDLWLSFPDELADAMESGEKESYNFPYTVEYIVNGKTFVPERSGSHYLVVRSGTGGYLEFFQPMGGNAYTEWPDSAVDPMGSVSLTNSGNRDCTNVVFKLTFDSNNTNAIGVTSVNLMTDVESEFLTIRYQMMDEYGNLYPEGDNRAEKKIKNPNYGSNKLGRERYAKFYREMLDVEAHKTLYFKEIQYTVGTIRTGESVGFQSNPKSQHSPGSYWGHALKESEVTPQTTAEIISAYWKDEDGEQRSARLPGTKTVETKINGPKDTTIVLDNAKTGFYTTTDTGEIQAGNSATLRIHGAVGDYIGMQNGSYLDGLRIGILLPFGVNINESTIHAHLGMSDTKPALPLENVTYQEAGDGKNIIWILEFAEGYPIGTSQENMTFLPNGHHFSVYMDINTSVNTSSMTLVAHQIIFAAAKGYTTIYSSIPRKDLYDINQNGSNTDSVTGLSETNERDLTIRGDNISLNIADDVLVNGKVKYDSDIAINSVDADIEYRINIKNQNGGIAENFASYFKIPQVLKDGAGDRIVMSGAGTVENTEDSTELKLLYTTETAVDMDAAKALDASKWTDTVTAWDQATWVKLVTADGTGIRNGSESTVTIPLTYSGNRYSYHAGASAAVKSEGSYDYVRGNFSLPIGIDTIQRTLSIHYTESSAKGETTLTAAYNREPTAPNVNTWYYKTDLTFYKAQTFRIENLYEHSLTLVDKTYDPDMKNMSSADSNSKYMIKIALTEGDKSTDTMDALQSLANAGKAILEPEEPKVTVGTTTAQSTKQTGFVFSLYNGNILTEASAERYVTFDLVSDYVTIPVKIVIQQEVTIANATDPAIMAGKQYLPFAGSTPSVTVAMDSAFTAQFVHTGLTKENYAGRTLTFNNPLPAGTTIVLLDYAKQIAIDETTGEETKTDCPPRYAHYTVSNAKTEISLTEFTKMGSNEKYTVNAHEGMFDEQLLFVFDLPDDNVIKYSDAKVTLTVAAKDQADIESVLTFTTSDKRTFTAFFDTDSAMLGSEFQFRYTVNNAENDSRYKDRTLALVVGGTDLPAEAKLTVGDTTYTRNSSGMFVIPLGKAQDAGTFSKTLSLQADSLENGESCELTAKLWVSATAVAEKPLMGDCVVNGLKITFTAEKEPSLKVDSMSQRVVDPEELKQNISLSYGTKDIPAGATVTLEVQKKVTSSSYSTDSVYIESVNGNMDSTLGVFTIPSEGGNLTLRFSSSLEAGNYRILFKVTDSSGKQLLEVPYRFVVVD